MTNELVKKVDSRKANAVLGEARARLLTRAESAARNGVNQLAILNHRSQQKFFEWFESSSLRVEGRAKNFFSSMDRPLGWLTNAVNDFDTKTRKYRHLTESERREKVEYDLEVSRMVDEGGFYVDDNSDFQGEQLRKAG